MNPQYRVQNPVDNQVIETFDFATDQEIAQTLDRSAAAFSEWRKTTFAERAEIVSRAAEILRERSDELSSIMAQEMGKQLPEGAWEVNFSADILQFYADRAEKHSADVEIPGIQGGKAMVRRLPLGPLLGVMPWNFPMYQVARFAGPNLMNGNTVILKHAEICPKSSAAFEQILKDAGLPDGAFINVYATHDQISTIIEDPRVQGVSLTGSERAGSAIASQAGKNLKKCVLELGGTDPYIVLDSSNVKEAAANAWATRVMNSGQVCTGNKRIIVMADIYDEFIEELTNIAKSYSQGDPQNPGENQYFPLSSRDAGENLEKQIDDAKSEGGVVHTGGNLLEGGAYFEPTVITDIPVGSDPYYQEFFGPVAEVYKVHSDEEAIAVANNSLYGLGGSVFSHDEERAKKVAAQVETGMIHVNLGQAFDPALPFGGVKRSGFGRELSVYALDEFVNKQTFYVND
ncbi:NAD-dependent succinate-semialdehyde dehydrogenase [Corynebacterium dentalis]|uniref:NAD-dependent succinate-semialdehyde dehydrogenase n=1 Tax=Corynebacterium dentalis TaxID=2014528 RepID=UPI0028A229F0|nr:NAD-dependent succinate-semialdehyde dehydrogenase [Corynebacterium dentalis]